MAVIPKRTKFRNVHRLPYDGKAKGNTKVSFGEYGLVALEGAWITDRQIEAAKAVGEKLGKVALAAGIKEVCFDRGGYLYHGRVAELAAGAREAGLEF